MYTTDREDTILPLRILRSTGCEPVESAEDITPSLYSQQAGQRVP